MSEENDATVENDTSGQPAEEMQSEIDDLIGGLTSNEDTSEDEEADKIIDGLEESAEEDTKDELEEEPDEQEDKEGDIEDSEEVSGEEESSEESERGDEEDSEEEGAKKGEKESKSDAVDLEAQNKMLMGLIATMQNPPAPKAVTESDSDTEDPSDLVADTPKTEPLGSFLGELDIDEVMGDPKIFNDLMQKHDSKLINATVQQVLLAIPKVIDSQVKQQNTINSAVNDFYRENNDLEAFKPIVGMAANQVQAEEPTWTMRQVLDEAAKRSRKAMGLRKQAVSQDDPTPRKSTRRKPGLPSKKPGARTPKSSQPKVTKLEKEIQDLM